MNTGQNAATGLYLDEEALGFLEPAAALFEHYGAKLYLEQVQAKQQRLQA
ncbi:MAG: hypothetical protein ACR2PL_07415 [Dehalococcoidia bacterium]